MESVGKKVVVIGAGIGGITTALFLAKKGYKVEIFEKNPNAGGRCGQLMQNGHRFDLGATILLMPSVYRQVFAELGLDMDTLLATESLEPVYKLYFGDGSDFAFTRNEEKMKSQLESIEPGSFHSYQKYINEGYEFFKIAIRDLLGRNFNHFFDFVNLKSIKILFLLKALRIHTTYINRFFKHPNLQKAFTFQNIYVGENPYKQPAFFSMLPAAEINEGALFPKGGMHRIVEKLSEEAIKAGVIFHFKSPVQQIVTIGKKAEGVLLESGESISADIVIANADLPYIYNQLLPKSLFAKRLNLMKYSCSALVFHWGMKKAYPQLAHHSIFLNEPYKEGMDKIFNEQSLSDNPSFYVHAPTRTDSNAAPTDEDSLSIIIPIGHIAKQKNQDWNEIKIKAKKAVINRLVAAGMEDIEDNIKFEICFTPKTFENYCNVTRGSVFGSVSHTLFQMGYFRPHNQHSKYKNLFFVGGSTHPGNGVPLVLLSAKLTSEKIIAYDSKNKK